jgi:hypothetical protein
MTILSDDDATPLVVYHGTRQSFNALDPSVTVDGGLHFGTSAQARMRAGKTGRLIEAHIDINSARRSRDLGSQWKKRIREARSAGHDAIVYLNRYEGIPLESVLLAQAEGVDLDRLTDSQFKKRIPEASDSWIVFSTDQVSILGRPQPTIHQRKPGL